MTQINSTIAPKAAEPQNSALPSVCTGTPSILPGNSEYVPSKPFNKYENTNKDANTAERCGQNIPSKICTCPEDHACYTSYEQYASSIWLWAKIGIFAIISFGIAFGLTYWKVQKRHNGMAQYWTYSVFGEVWVGLILASVVPFIVVPLVLGRLNTKRKISWLKPVKLEYLQRSRIRFVVPTLQSNNRWYSVLLVTVVFIIFAALPLLLVLGLVLEGNTHEMNAATWSGIYGAWVTVIHTVSFLVAFAWSVVHIVKPYCAIHPAADLVDIPSAEK